MQETEIEIVNIFQLSSLDRQSLGAVPMIFLPKFFTKRVLGCGLSLALLAPLGSAHAGQARVLYAFKGMPDGTYPSVGLVGDKKGYFFGTTIEGGELGCEGYGCGIVFRIAPDGSETVLHAFKDGSDGASPLAALIFDKTGNLYGTTYAGGGRDKGCGGFGCGTVFKIAPNGAETVLYAFKGGNDGSNPAGALLRDKSGNLFGTTAGGGISSQYCSTFGCGTVFKIAPNGTKSTLYAFCSQAGCTDGANPAAGLIADELGNLYGTTSRGGNQVGTVFMLSKDGSESVLYSFRSVSDGQYPYAGVTMDKAENLFGTTYGGGKGNDQNGTVYKLAPDGTETLLHSFLLGTDGAMPEAGVIIDKAGNLYGTTYFSGATDCKRNGTEGAVFRLSPDGSEKIFCILGNIEGGVIEKNGVLYGTTQTSEKHRNGTVFALAK